jgi:hypothetical protein
LADTEINAIICGRKGCSQPFKRGDWIYSKPTSGGKTRRYHLKCALAMILLTRAEIPQYKKVVYILALTSCLTGWAHMVANA